ncbi:jg18559, partial [Pararge aegeria aegeria]
MFVLFLMMAASAVAMEKKSSDPVADQLIKYKNSTPDPIGVLTTSSGAPVPHNATSTLNTPLLRNKWFLDSLIQLFRSRTPERLVHAKGTGAFGHFEATHDISHICSASFLKKGKKTPVAVRFSTSAGQRGSTDLVMDARGFAIKFYTDEGNFDIPGFNTPMFSFKDPLHFHTSVQTARRNPATNVLDSNMSWDMFTKIPETLHIMILLFSGRGQPARYQNMPGFGIHTYQVTNVTGGIRHLRWHIEPNAGIKNLTPEKADNISITNPDFLTTDLYQAISNGKYPSWTVSVQVVNENDMKKNASIICDPTKVLSKDKYPLQPIGQMTLNRNPKNFFAEIEQLAFCPGNLVPGIDGAPDKLFESRLLAYRDAHNYRLGANFNKIPVNCPFQVNALTYNRDGVPPVGDNEGGAPNYYPNSFNGPEPYTPKHYSPLITI